MSFWGDDFYNSARARRGNNRTGSFPLLPLLAVMVIAGLMVLPFAAGRHPAAVPMVAAPAGPASEMSIAEAAALVKPAVVSVINHPLPRGEQEDDLRSLMYGQGSGIIFDASASRALVVTNHHVIEGGAELEIVLTTGERRKAELIGSDRFIDLAVLEIDGKDIQHVARFGDSDLLEAGQPVVAIGNPLGISYSQTITAGIISSLRTPVPVSLAQDGRADWEAELIQTDAAINRGNSGGALVNLRGEVIGINSMKVSDYGVEGLGFAIPINEASEVLESLLQYGKVKRPFIGIVMEDLFFYRVDRDKLNLPDEVKRGVVVMTAEGPAMEAGLQSGDVIVRLDDTDIASMLDLRKYLYRQKSIGEMLEVTFFRGKEEMSVRMRLAEREEQ